MGNLYTKLKIFHFQDKIDSLPVSIDSILSPLHIRIKPTNICNHRCWYCAYRAQDLQLGKDMVIKDTIPQAKMMEIVEDIAAMGVKAVTFSGGGEPFCYPFVIPTVKELIKYHVKFASLTNGALLSGEAAELFAHHGTWVRISMDGWDDGSYIKYRHVQDGEFTKILNNIKAFKAFRGRCLLGVSFILDKDNYTHFYDVAKQLKVAGVDSLKVAPCIVSNTSEGNNDYHEPFFEAAQEVIHKACCDLADEKFELYNTYHKQQISFSKDYDWCPYLQILPIIGADLNVYSCQDKAYNLDCGLIGSIKDIRFRDFWFKDKSKFFKIKPSCDCSHHCVADGKNKLVFEYLKADPEHLGFV
ncbi:MAG: radical SAM protein [Candidatus Omnitrophota bacterium]|nr:radical SAM protein [Candidatus Omnitrophota bacterium]